MSSLEQELTGDNVAFPRSIDDAVRARYLGQHLAPSSEALAKLSSSTESLPDRITGSEGSAFRKINSATGGGSAFSSTGFRSISANFENEPIHHRNGNGGGEGVSVRDISFSREVLSPGVPISPTNVYERQPSLRQTIGKDSLKRVHQAVDTSVDAGPFQHHIPLATPLHDLLRHPFSYDAPLEDRMGLSSSPSRNLLGSDEYDDDDRTRLRILKSTSPDIVGIINQLVANNSASSSSSGAVKNQREFANSIDGGLPPGLLSLGLRNSFDVSSDWAVAPSLADLGATGDGSYYGSYSSHFAHSTNSSTESLRSHLSAGEINSLQLRGSYGSDDELAPAFAAMRGSREGPLDAAAAGRPYLATLPMPQYGHPQDLPPPPGYCVRPIQTQLRTQTRSATALIHPLQQTPNQTFSSSNGEFPSFQFPQHHQMRLSSVVQTSNPYTHAGFASQHLARQDPPGAMQGVAAQPQYGARQQHGTGTTDFPSPPLAYSEDPKHIGYGDNYHMKSGYGSAGSSLDYGTSTQRRHEQSSSGEWHRQGQQRGGGGAVGAQRHHGRLSASGGHYAPPDTFARDSGGAAAAQEYGHIQAMTRSKPATGRSSELAQGKQQSRTGAASAVGKRPSLTSSLSSSLTSSYDKFDAIVPVNVMNPQNNRLDILESPRSKGLYKEFYRQLRAKEKESIAAAVTFASQELLTLPEKLGWRVCLELADFAKKSNDSDGSRRWFEEACRRQPLASQVWLEWSKMEEERGKWRRSLRILREGLARCTFNEGLLTKAIKQQERLHNIQAAREMLGILKHESIDKSWKAVLEGTLLEARVGRSSVARKFFKYLTEHVPWYGPIYFEAYRLEEKEGNTSVALEIIHKGLMTLPRYGPLWFGLLRIMERKDAAAERRRWLLGAAPQLLAVRQESTRATRLISRELVWKVYYELAHAEERAVELAAYGLHVLSPEPLHASYTRLLAGPRVSLVRCLLACPSNLRWKVLLAGSRMELAAGDLSAARRLLCRALVEVPHKSRAQVYLECARVEEYSGNIACARRILSRARGECRSEWKVFLESVLLETRVGDLAAAVAAANDALRYHSGTGRLWALLAQLAHRASGLSPLSGPRMPSKHDVLLRALLEVPKSGEVWCEGARCHLNPLDLPSFDPSKAQKYLSFAIQFTPQYGDTFIEYLRLEVLSQVLLPRALQALGVPVAPFMRRFLAEDCESDTVDFVQHYSQRAHADTAAAQQTAATEIGLDDTSSPTRQSGDDTSSPTRQRRRKIMIDMEHITHHIGNMREVCQTVLCQNISRRCVNADPNYGTVWYFCRSRPFDIPHQVLRGALDMIALDLCVTHKVYMRAFLHYVVRGCAIMGAEAAQGQDPSGNNSINSNSSGYKVYDEVAADFNIAERMLGHWPCGADADKVAFAAVDGGLLGAADFVSSTVELNRLLYSRRLSENDRRKVIFGTDQLLA